VQHCSEGAFAQTRSGFQGSFRANFRAVSWLSTIITSNNVLNSSSSRNVVLKFIHQTLHAFESHFYCGLFLQLQTKMGVSLGKALNKLFGNKEMRVLMLGLDAAGKTSILLLKMSGAVTVVVLLNIKSNLVQAETRTRSEHTPYCWI
jgi:hypothetical protein